ncbi:hypothetical protein LCGC14_1036950 [marine sediment metagenome]|uniref:N-acetyltransferase domain-containing protein n=1 Tax=marine sediment metagenome TaxID=412755 RepID=A0A0F9MSZ5_9ZZZZ
MKYEIKKLEEREVVKAVELFNAIVDELHADSPVTERSHYKETYPVEEVKERLSNKDNVYLVGKLGKEIVSFMFAWASDGVGNIYWLGVKPKYRKKGYARKLMDETIKQFTKKSCHEARVFSYPKEKGAHKLFKSFGFEEKSFIDKQFFGISIILMERKLAPVPIKKIAKKMYSDPYQEVFSFMKEVRKIDCSDYYKLMFSVEGLIPKEDRKENLPIPER